MLHGNALFGAQSGGISQPTPATVRGAEPAAEASVHNPALQRPVVAPMFLSDGAAGPTPPPPPPPPASAAPSGGRVASATPRAEPWRSLSLTGSDIATPASAPPSMPPAGGRTPASAAAHRQSLRSEEPEPAAEPVPAARAAAGAPRSVAQTMGEAIVAHEQDKRKYLKENKELKR
eukprot:5031958-Prymnesium_polylepis.1